MTSLETLGFKQVDDSVVTISTKEYVSLKDDQFWRQCVEDAGVDNWEGYYFAMKEYYKDEDS